MISTVIWWDTTKHSGVAAATENGTTQRYYLLESRIISSPEVIEPGDIAEFTFVIPPKRPDLLPVASGVRITKKQAPATVAASSEVHQ